MRSWTTFTGALTTIGYEAATLLPSGPEKFKPIVIDWNKGNGLIMYDDVKKMDPFGLSSGATSFFDKDDDDTLNPHIGIRINSLSTYDPVTLEQRERKFEYLDAMCNIDLKGVVHTDFKSLSGSYDIVMSAGKTLKVLRKTSSVALLESSRGVGYAPENARLFYGKVRERIFDYGDSLAVIMNEYNYDTDICRLSGISGGGIPKKDSLITRGSFLFDIMLPITSPKYRGEMFSGGIVNGYYRETIGAQPLLKSCVSYRLRDTTYIPERTVIYAYELCDSVRIPVGTFHEPVVRTFGNTKMKSYNYKSYCDFSFFQYEVLAFRPLLRATSEYTHFPDGASRHNTSHFIYTSDSTYSAVCDNSIPWAIGLYSNGSWNALPSPGSPLRPFKADSLDAVTAARLPFGVISVVGGNAIERYTPTSAKARSGFFADVAAGGRLTLPIATMWVVNGCDTLLQHNEYVKSGNRINLSRTSLGAPGHHPISVQSFNKGYLGYMPLGMKQTGSPQKTYTWDSCDQLTSISIGEGPDALTSSYTYDNYVGCTGIYGPAGDRQTFSYSGGRLATVRNNLGKLTAKYEYEFLRDEGVSTFTGTNSIRTTTYGSDSDSSSVREIYDAFGLPVVTVTERVADGSDLISVRRFDALGRQLAAWRPLMVTDSILIGDIRNPYDYVLEDESQIQYGQKEGCDRTAYIGSTVVHRRAGREFAGHPDSLCVLCSNPDIPELRVVRYMLAYGKLETGIRKPPSGKLANSDVYSHGELNCVKSTDADGRVSLTFSSANGRTVLVRAIGDKGEFADTYTLYNSWGDPVVVLPPSYSANLARNPSSTNLARYSSQAYLYTYDRQHRLRSKKAPGQQPVEFVYDIEGRQAFSRDGSQKEAGIRSFMLYDHLGRVAVTGTCSDSGPDIWDGTYLAPAMDTGKPGRQGDASTLCSTGYTPSGGLNALLVSPRLQSASYYDSYSSVIHQLPAEAIAEPKGMCTATLTAILDNASWQPVLTTMYYDSSLRLIRSTSNCPLSGSVQRDYRYNAHGTLLSTDETYRQSRQIGIPVSHSRSFTNDHLGRPATESLKYGSRGFRTRSYSYNSLGQLYRTTGYGNDLSCTYSYNINGWLTQWSTPFVTERYAYGYSPMPSYSGKISMRQTSKGSGFCNQYVYSYDRLGRLTNAAFTNLQDSEVDYSASYTYDIDSNPLTIKRSGLTDVGVYGTVNDIKIEYDNRRPRGVSDVADAPLLEGILAPPPSVAINRTHEYDCAGRLTRDATRGIDSIRYNVIGLPQAVYFADGSSLEYTYMADGTKLRETRRRPSFVSAS
ncbi:MAG: hypothetical protein K2H03_06190, partial [Muribaculaceae bacterium]|nr:hypothetical protein [Muribaculaceae bacterium]